MPADTPEAFLESVARWAASEATERELLQAVSDLTCGHDPVAGGPLPDGADPHEALRYLASEGRAMTGRVVEALIACNADLAREVAANPDLDGGGAATLARRALDALTELARPARLWEDDPPRMPVSSGHGSEQRNRLEGAADVLGRIERHGGLEPSVRRRLLVWVEHDFAGYSGPASRRPRAYRARAIVRSALGSRADWTEEELIRLYRHDAADPELQRQVIRWTRGDQRAVYETVLGRPRLPEPVLEALADDVAAASAGGTPRSNEDGWWAEPRLARRAAAHGHPLLTARLLPWLAPEEVGPRFRQVAEADPSRSLAGTLVRALEALDNARRAALDRRDLRPLLENADPEVRDRVLRVLGSRPRAARGR